MSEGAPLIHKLPRKDEGNATPRNGSADSSSSDIDDEEPQKTLTWLNLVALLFFWVCGGAFGIEDAIGAGGPLFSLIGMLMVVIFWSAPQALMSAELSLSIGDNGGQFVWPLRAMGPHVSWVNGWNLLLSNWVSQAALPILVVEYLPPMSTFAGTMVKFVVILFVVGVNLVGAKFVSRINAVLGPSIFLSFCIVGVVGMLNGSTSKFKFGDAIRARPPLDEINWTLLFSTLIWCCGSFDSVGSVAQEVKGGMRSYWLAFYVSLPLILVNYFIPVILLFMVNPDFHKWTSGSFARFAEEVSPACGILMTVTAVTSNVAQLSSAFVPTARIVWAGARLHGMEQMFPALMSFSWTVGAKHVPAAAVLLSAFGTICMSVVNFETAMNLYLSFRLVNLFFEFLALIVLRYTEPELPRPYKTSIYMAWAMILPVVAVSVFTVTQMPKFVLLLFLGINAILLVIYAVHVLLQGHIRLWRPEVLCVDFDAVKHKVESTVTHVVHV